MRDALVALAWCLGFLLLIIGMVALVRAAKRAGNRMASVAGTVMLLFTFGFAPEADRQRIEEARESKGKKGGESGDPPDPEQ